MFAIATAIFIGLATLGHIDCDLSGKTPAQCVEPVYEYPQSY